MSKPRLTNVVLRGLTAMAAHMSAEPWDEMVDSGSLNKGDVRDMIRVMGWIRGMHEHRRDAAHGPEEEK